MPSGLEEKGRVARHCLPLNCTVASTFGHSNPALINTQVCALDETFLLFPKIDLLQQNSLLAALVKERDGGVAWTAWQAKPASDGRLRKLSLLFLFFSREKRSTEKESSSRKKSGLPRLSKEFISSFILS